MNPPVRPLLRLALVGAAALLLVLPPGHADSGKTHEHLHDHERARAALQAGEVLPLIQILQKVQRSHPGDVLEVELERDDGRWIYELKLLQSDGVRLKLEVDAKTGEVLRSRQRPLPGQASAPAPRAPPEPGR